MKEQYQMVSNATGIEKGATNDSPNCREEIAKFESIVFTMGDIPYLLECVSCDTLLKIVEGIVGIKYLLTAGQKPRFEDFVEKIMKHAENVDVPSLQCISAQTFGIAISAGYSGIEQFLNSKGVSFLINLIKSSNQQVTQILVQSLCKMIKQFQKLRQKIIQEGGVDILIGLLKRFMKKENKIIYIFSLYELCYFRYEGDVSEAISLMVTFLLEKDIENKEYKTVCLQFVDYYSRTNMNKVEPLLTEQFLKAIISFLKDSTLQQQLSCLQIISRFALQGPSQVQTLLSFGILEAIMMPLTYSRRIVREYACAVVADLTSHKGNEASTILGCETLLMQLLEMFSSEKGYFCYQICRFFINISKNEMGILILTQYFSYLLQTCISFMDDISNNFVKMTLYFFYILITINEKNKLKEGVTLINEQQWETIETILRRLEIHEDQEIFCLTQLIRDNI